MQWPRDGTGCYKTTTWCRSNTRCACWKPTSVAPTKNGGVGVVLDCQSSWDFDRMKFECCDRMHCLRALKRRNGCTIQVPPAAGFELAWFFTWQSGRWAARARGWNEPSTTATVWCLTGAEWAEIQAQVASSAVPKRCVILCDCELVI